MDENENIAEDFDSVSDGDEVINDGDTGNSGEDFCEYEVRTLPKKKRTVSYLMAALLVILTGVLVFQITYLAVGQMYKREINSLLSNGMSNSKLNEINQIYKENFIYDFTEDDIADGLIRGYIYGTGDRYGAYYSPEEYQAYIDQLNDKSVGIGVIVGFDADENAIEVYKVYDGSPADKAGIEVGDRIFSVDGTKVSEVGYNKAADLMLGDIGKNVALTVRKSDSAVTKDISVTRNEYVVSTVDYKLMDKIGYIKISNFYSDTPTELKDAVVELKSQGAESLIFDVRDNSGGLLVSIQKVLDYLLPKGVMFTIKDKKGNEEVFNSDNSCVDMPMVILVNSGTGSAAELFTSALMDYKKAVSVGEKTHGKGSVTSPFKLSDGSYIYVSNALYYPPVSDNFDGKGITPDYKVSLSYEASRVSLYKLAPEDDAQLQYALELLKK